jgi:hypothetical protein
MPPPSQCQSPFLLDIGLLDEHHHRLLDENRTIHASLMSTQPNLHRSKPPTPLICTTTSSSASTPTGGGAIPNTASQHLAEDPIYFLFFIKGLVCKKVGLICNNF